MGILDDLAMGFGMKERTEDYDARTARNIAVSEQYDNEFDRIRARQSGDYDVTRGGAAQFLGSRGRDNYNPQIAQDNRPFMQRALYSPESAPSPTPYAIGPMSMDQPLPQFGIFGLLSSLANFNRQNVPTVSADTSPMRVRPGYTGGQPETTFNEDFSGVETADFEKPMPIDALNTLVTSALQNVPDQPSRDQMLEALYELTGDYQGTFYSDDVLRDAYKKHVIDGVPVPFDRKKVPPLAADPTSVQRLPVTSPGRVVVDDSNLKPYLPNDGLLSPAFGPGDTGYYDQQMNMGVNTDQLFTPSPIGMRLITSGPHAGKYVDRSGRIRMP